MLRITTRVLIILLISAIIGIGIMYIVNHVINTTLSASFEGNSEVFKWLRRFSSFGLIGVMAHSLPFVLITIIVVGMERLYAIFKK